MTDETTPEPIAGGGYVAARSADSFDAELSRALLHVVEDYRGDLDTERVVEALENEIDRVRNTEGNRGLQEFAS